MMRTVHCLASLILLHMHGPAAAEPVGPLFTTAEQRQASESKLRTQAGSADSGAIVHGQVRRSHGPRTRWINGMEEAQIADETAANPSEALIRPVPGQRDDPLLRGGVTIVHPARR